MNDIAVVPARDSAMQVYAKEGGLDPYLKHIRDELDAFEPDATTRKGREQIASMAHKVARSKTALDSLGKELVAELKDVPRKIDAERKRMRDILDQWKDEVRRPLTEWEAAEERRVAAHKLAIEGMRALGETEDLDSTALTSRLSAVRAIKLGEHWQEFEPEAARLKDRIVSELESAMAKRIQWEAEQAELERLRKEAVEREQRERDERIAREAEARAKAEAEEAARKEREAADARERAAKEAEARAVQAAAESERRRIEAERNAENERLAAAEREKQAAERARQEEAARAEAERKRLADEQAKREADTKHKASINREAVADLVAAGLSEANAKAAVTAIAKGQIRNVRISY